MPKIDYADVNDQNHLDYDSISGFLTVRYSKIVDREQFVPALRPMFHFTRTVFLAAFRHLLEQCFSTWAILLSWVIVVSLGAIEAGF